MRTLPGIIATFNGDTTARNDMAARVVDNANVTQAFVPSPGATWVLTAGVGSYDGATDTTTYTVVLSGVPDTFSPGNAQFYFTGDGTIRATDWAQLSGLFLAGALQPGSPNQYPTQADLEAAIEGLGVLDPSTYSDVFALMRTDVKAAAAVAEWERRTGWKPFLKDSADVTRSFDPPGAPRYPGGQLSSLYRGGDRHLDFDAGLLSLTSLYVGVTTTDPGSPLVQGENFWLYPYDAPIEGRPWEGVEFSTPRWGMPGSVRITGRWGYTATLDSDVWQAILYWGLYLCYQPIAMQISKGLYSIRRGETEIRYEGRQAPLSREAQNWHDDFLEKAAQLKRVVL